MHNNKLLQDIYLMGIGGVGMGAFAGLLKQAGFKVRGSDLRVYSPMKEKLEQWNISYNTPYDAINLQKAPDLVIVGNVIRRENPEALAIESAGVPFDSFPSALKRIFLDHATPLVASGTHGKTTCSALLAHTLFHCGKDPSFLIGGIPLNFGESFRLSKANNPPFVVEGDEYDTSYFDKQPKFMHYAPHYLLTTSLEFDHGDIYADLSAIIKAFTKLFSLVKESGVIVVNHNDKNIKTALTESRPTAPIFTYGAGGDYSAHEINAHENGLSFNVYFRKLDQGAIEIPLFGDHNLMNALGCYALLRSYGLSHHEIAGGFKTFAGVKRRLEHIGNLNNCPVLEDFAHHPTAVLETIKAVRQKYPAKKIWAIFEPRSATSCTKVFENDYVLSFKPADQVFLGRPGRVVIDGLDPDRMRESLTKLGTPTFTFEDNHKLFAYLRSHAQDCVLLIMSNGDFGGEIKELKETLSFASN
jgi:UDP-N-acetylmuramate: L-alanyl-gamma-D-glutamyl-meso-diaminopimelate ligase